ncbi:oligosaccharide flippase family protein [Paenibacillus sp. N1-5-1-14]|nr:oligosaccharide flippase family protein [Paenibacillus radicibacter]
MNTWWMLLGQGSRILIQAVYFIIIARVLGPQGFGAFVGVVSLMAILSQFTGLGTGLLMIKHVARDQTSFPVFWGNALAVTIASGLIMIGLSLGIAHLVFPTTISLSLVLVIAFSDLLFLPLLDLSTLAFQSFEKMFWTSQLQVVMSVLRMIFALFLLFFDAQPLPEDWGILYLIGTIVSAAIGFIMVTFKLGLPDLNLSRYYKEAKDGLYLCLSQLAQSIFNDADKSMMPRLSSVEAAGIYTSAYRIIDVSFTPIRSLLAASMSRMFKYGEAGIEGVWSFARKIILIGCALGAVTGVFLYFIAPVMTYILGSSYQSSIFAIQWLAVIPLFKAINYFAADMLTGSGYQGRRSFIQFTVGFISIVMNLILIPKFSWHGAVFMNIAANFLLAIGLWGAVINLRKQERRKPTAALYESVSS